MRYWDIYDWHADLNWQFDIRLGFLPFTIEIKGQDNLFAKVGKEFVTAGTIAPDNFLTTRQHDYMTKNTLSLSKLVRNIVWHTKKFFGHQECPNSRAVIPNFND